jgi:hypothetical protein
MEGKLKIIRKWISARTTIGELYINDSFFCYTLEDTVRAYGIKVPRETAIPQGIYKVNVTRSTRFKRDLPMVFTESNGYELINGGISFKGIRFHGGNTHKNTEGCILVAYNKIDSNTIQGTAERDLVKELSNFNSITLEVVNNQEK